MKLLLWLRAMSNFLNNKTNRLFSLSLPGVLLGELTSWAISLQLTPPPILRVRTMPSLVFSPTNPPLSLNDSSSSSHFHNWSPFLLPESNLHYIAVLNNQLHQGFYSNAPIEQGGSPDEWEIFVHAYSKWRVGSKVKRRGYSSVPFTICHMKMLSNRPTPLDLWRKAHFLYMI